MKKLLLAAMIVCGLASNAQESKGTQTEKGKFVIEVNTGSSTTGNTSFSFFSRDGKTTWSAGLEGGYFVIDNLAIKTGLGYSSTDNIDSFRYKIGAEYYIEGIIPIGIDFTGSHVSFDDSYYSDTYNSNWIGIQGGYAYFLGENVSIKPTIRYNIGLENGQKGEFQGLIGFALYF